jgi:hypothetical protein
MKDVEVCAYSAPGGDGSIKYGCDVTDRDGRYSLEVPMYSVSSFKYKYKEKATHQFAIFGGEPNQTRIIVQNEHVELNHHDVTTATLNVDLVGTECRFSLSDILQLRLTKPACHTNFELISNAVRHPDDVDGTRFTLEVPATDFFVELASVDHFGDNIRSALLMEYFMDVRFDVDLEFAEAETPAPDTPGPTTSPTTPTTFAPSTWAPSATPTSSAPSAQPAVMSPTSMPSSQPSFSAPTLTPSTPTTFAPTTYAPSLSPTKAPTLSTAAEDISRLITFQYDDLDPLLSVAFYQGSTLVSHIKEGCAGRYLVLDKPEKTQPAQVKVTGRARLFEDDSLVCNRIAGGVLIMNLLSTIPVGLNECYPLCEKDFEGEYFSVAVEETSLSVPDIADPFHSPYTVIYSGPQQRYVGVCLTMYVSYVCKVCMYGYICESV